jgi:hypothetical protein
MHGPAMEAEDEINPGIHTSRAEMAVQSRILDGG